LQQYDTLSKLHRESVKAFFEELRNSKEKSFKELGASGFTDSIIEVTASQGCYQAKRNGY
jgi:hypothetical protein